MSKNRSGGILLMSFLFILFGILCLSVAGISRIPKITDMTPFGYLQVYKMLFSGVMVIAGIGIFRQKSRARLFSVYAVPILLFIFFHSYASDNLSRECPNNYPNWSKEEMFNYEMSQMSLSLESVEPFAWAYFISFPHIWFLTRPKIKEQFN